MLNSGSYLPEDKKEEHPDQDIWDRHQVYNAVVDAFGDGIVSPAFQHCPAHGTLGSQAIRKNQGRQQ